MLDGNWMELIVIAALVGVPTILSVAVLCVYWRLTTNAHVQLFRLRQNDTVVRKIVPTGPFAPVQTHPSPELQSLGLLCATVVHDFGNLLSVILVNAASLKSNAHPSEEALEIEQAALEAADLCKQLLSLARGGSSVSEVTSLNELVEAELPLLRRLVSRQVLLLWEPGPDLCVDAARTEFRQLLLNLCANARDAMPAGGDVRLSTAFVQRIRSDERGSERLGCLTITDTGSGMDEETRTRLFEPFFTTKGPKQGTGLGMAVVAAAAARHNASIEIESQVGVGTRISILFPLIEPQLEARPSHVRATALPGSEVTAAVNTEHKPASAPPVAC